MYVYTCSCTEQENVEDSRDFPKVPHGIRAGESTAPHSGGGRRLIGGR
jgi:hypothetical protein